MLSPLIAQQSNPITMLFPFIILAALIYFFGIRPVSVQKKKQEQLHSSLRIGDDVITIGAFKGTIIGIDDDGYELQLSEDTTAFVLKAGIARKVLKETDLVDEEWDEDDEAGTEERNTDHEEIALATSPDDESPEITDPTTADHGDAHEEPKA
ncbi:preprotein translocase subunit YajC [Stomatohabitans albus]|uniref:preprotein translocase subunit YajC n=1 Tax=Stomatohabitans albus TaxID=3110766 RepID=UPI00300D3BD0